MNNYPLYDVPWLVRDPNDFRMSAKRHAIELRNQAVVDDYFFARSKGIPAKEARRQTAEKHQIKPWRVLNILTWFFHEAEKRKKTIFWKNFCLRRNTKIIMILSLQRLS